MIYITQLIFIKKGEQSTFHTFEDHAIPLLAKYNGKVEYRVRPTAEQFINATPEQELPYEIHLVSFPTQADFEAFLQDDTRQQFVHLKEASVKTMLLVKGQPL